MSTAGGSWLQRGALHWRTLSARERVLVAGTATAVLLLLLWFVALAPALRVLADAPQRMQRVDAQLADVTRMAREAQAIQARPALSRAQSIQALESSVRQRLGAAAQLRVVGSRVTLTLSGCAPSALSQWLAQARSSARVLPVEARLQRGANGWSGSLLFDLPPET